MNNWLLPALTALVIYGFGGFFPKLASQYISPRIGGPMGPYFPQRSNRNSPQRHPLCRTHEHGTKLLTIGMQTEKPEAGGTW